MTATNLSVPFAVVGGLVAEGSGRRLATRGRLATLVLSLAVATCAHPAVGELREGALETVSSAMCEGIGEQGVTFTLQALTVFRTYPEGRSPEFGDVLYVQRSPAARSGQNRLWQSTTGLHPFIGGAGLATGAVACGELPGTAWLVTGRMYEGNIQLAVYDLRADRFVESNLPSPTMWEEGSLGEVSPPTPLETLAIENPWRSCSHEGLSAARIGSQLFITFKGGRYPGCAEEGLILDLSAKEFGALPKGWRRSILDPKREDLGEPAVTQRLATAVCQQEGLPPLRLSITRYEYDGPFSHFEKESLQILALETRGDGSTGTRQLWLDPSWVPARFGPNMNWAAGLVCGTKGTPTYLIVTRSLATETRVWVYEIPQPKAGVPLVTALALLTDGRLAKGSRPEPLGSLTARVPASENVGMYRVKSIEAIDEDAGVIRMRFSATPGGGSTDELTFSVPGRGFTRVPREWQVLAPPAPASEEP